MSELTFVCLSVVAHAPARRTSSEPKTTYRPKQVTELTCYACDKTNSLVYFTKSLRMTRDTARCIKCADDSESEVSCRSAPFLELFVLSDRRNRDA
jgi:hypothetical protein